MPSGEGTKRLDIPMVGAGFDDQRRRKTTFIVRSASKAMASSMVTMSRPTNSMTPNYPTVMT